jgi:hypothetical protein
VQEVEVHLVAEQPLVIFEAVGAVEVEVRIVTNFLKPLILELPLR